MPMDGTHITADAGGTTKPLCQMTDAQRGQVTLLTGYSLGTDTCPDCKAIASNYDALPNCFTYEADSVSAGSTGITLGSFGR